MLFNNDNPDILNLLEKIQEVTTSDVDEEIGSFKVGDRVTYNMLGGVLSNSDLIKMLGANEHALRVNHDNTIAEIVEAIGEEASRYSLQFEDDFVIADVALSEIKVMVNEAEERYVYGTRDEKWHLVGPEDRDYADGISKKEFDEMGPEAAKAKYLRPIRVESKTNEAEDATQTMKPQEKPDLNADDIHMEDYSEVDLHKHEVEIKSKSEESGDAIRKVEDKELEQTEDEVVKPKNESKLKEGRQEYIDKCVKVFKASGGTVQQKIAYMKTKGATDSEITQALDTASGGEVVRSALGGVEDKNESRVDEDQRTVDRFIDKGISRLPHVNDDVSKVMDELMSAEGEKLAPEEWQAVEKELQAIVDSYVDESKAEETLASSEEITAEKIGLKNKVVVAYKKYRETGKSREEAVQRVGKDFVEVGAPEIRKILDIEGVMESNLSFLKKQKPLWLCNECFRTFRADECTCTFCESTDTENLSEGYGDLVGSTKEVFKVTWKNEETGKEESTRVMAFDADDAKRETERNPKKKDVKVEGPIKSAEKGDESKVEEDYREVSPGKYLVVYYDGHKEEIEAESKVDAMKKGRENYPEKRISNVQKLQSKGGNKAPFEQVSEGSELTEGVGELVGETPGIDVEDQKILNWALENNAIPMAWPSDEVMIDQLSGGDMHVPGEGAEDKDGLDLGEIKASYLKYILLPKAVKAYEVHVSESEVTEAEQEGIPVAGRTYHITQTTGRNWPEGDYKVITVDYLRSVRGDLAKQFRVEGNDNWWMAEFYHFEEVDGSKDESKLKEQDEDFFITVGKGLEKEDAEKLAQEKDGQVIVDPDDDQKFAVITKGE